MKNNAVYTAREIVAAIPVETFTADEKTLSKEEIFGNVSVTIGGIRGVVSPDHIITIPEGVGSMEVSVGVETFTIELDNNDGEREHSEAKQEAVAVELQAEAEAHEEVEEEVAE